MCRSGIRGRGAAITCALDSPCCEDGSALQRRWRRRGSARRFDTLGKMVMRTQIWTKRVCRGPLATSDTIG